MVNNSGASLCLLARSLRRHFDSELWLFCIANEMYACKEVDIAKFFGWFSDCDKDR